MYVIGLQLENTLGNQARVKCEPLKEAQNNKTVNCQNVPGSLLSLYKTFYVQSLLTSRVQVFNITTSFPFIDMMTTRKSYNKQPSNNRILFDNGLPRPHAVSSFCLMYLMSS